MNDNAATKMQQQNNFMNMLMMNVMGENEHVTLAQPTQQEQPQQNSSASAQDKLATKYELQHK